MKNILCVFLISIIVIIIYSDWNQFSTWTLKLSLLFLLLLIYPSGFVINNLQILKIELNVIV